MYHMEPLSVNFSYFVTFKPIGWSWTRMDLLSMQHRVTLSIVDLENINSSSYIDLPGVDTFCFTVRKMEFTSVATDLIKVFNY